MTTDSPSVAPMHIGVSLSAWAAFRDRFAAYREASPVLEAIREAAAIPGIEGIDVSRGYMPQDIRPVKETLQEVGLKASAVGTAISKDPRTVYGAFSSEDAGVRRLVVGIVKECMDVAADLGTDKVLLWFGQDGYDYHFEVDYAARWARMVEGLRECAQYRPDIRVCIEYKAREPKLHQFVHSAAVTLVLIDEVGEENVGVLFDTGHALLAGEMLAETAVMVARRGKLWHVHLNDNYFHTDSDMIPGTVHPMAFLELFYWLRQLGYDGFLSYDTVAMAHDPKRVIAECVRYTQALVAAADRLPRGDLEKALGENDPTVGLAAARQALFSG
ncbi:MAG: sugar phosphate isomerase/epimerase family protein [Anaerolineae bacterium]